MHRISVYPKPPPGPRYPPRPRPELSIRQILRWADAHLRDTGEWPMRDSGWVSAIDDDTWAAVDAALCKGVRGLPGGSSLAQLLAERRGVRNRKDLPPLTVKQVLAWADAHRRRKGRWPTYKSGPIADSPGDTWAGVDAALRDGLRGCRPGSSLAKVLARHRGVRYQPGLPRLTIDQILAWADAHHRRTGQWPREDSGPITDAPIETWGAVTNALGVGLRGLPGGSSLARLLAEKRGVRNRAELPRLTLKQILAWADAHHRRTGAWPKSHSGPVQDAPGETWMAVEMALSKGRRGLPGGSSLARLLAERRQARYQRDLIQLTDKQILAWADAHHRRTGQWPKAKSGPVADAPGETWTAVDNALRYGLRGSPGGRTLAQLLAERRGVRNHLGLPPLTLGQVLAWADAHHRRTGTWPAKSSGPILDAPGETWGAVDNALSRGNRGLPGSSSLNQLLVQRRGKRSRSHPPP